MAANDKMYLKEYYDLNDLRTWSLIYYPELIAYFYADTLQISYKEFNEAKASTAHSMKEMFYKQWKNLSSDGTVNCAIAYLKSKGLDEKEATERANDAYKNYKKTEEDLKREVNFPVMNTPIKVDKKLKWICPLPAVRSYLRHQCGVKEHWYYKLFWKGKKHFML